MLRPALLLALLAVLSLGVGAASAATFKSYSANFSGNHGTAKLTVKTDGSGSLAASVRSMTAGGWGVALYRGTCASLGSRIASLSTLSVGAARSGSRTYGISKTVVTKMKGTRVAVRLTKSGQTAVCASLASISVPPTPAPTPPSSNCHPSYQGVCLRPDASDYDCAGGSGNGPYYAPGPFRVVGYDEYDLDRDGDGIGCE
jgi:hypothetical protein